MEDVLSIDSKYSDSDSSIGSDESDFLTKDLSHYLDEEKYNNQNDDMILEESNSPLPSTHNDTMPPHNFDEQEIIFIYPETSKEIKPMGSFESYVYGRNSMYRVREKKNISDADNHNNLINQLDQRIKIFNSFKEIIQSSAMLCIRNFPDLAGLNNTETNLFLTCMIMIMPIIPMMQRI
jgi:hypothetical protein